MTTTKKTYRTTRLERQIIASRLSKDLDRWGKMSDLQLEDEVRLHFPAVASATRHECYKFLTMLHVENMIP